MQTAVNKVAIPAADEQKEKTMAGRITKSEQQLRPDPKFGDKVLSKFINCIMKGGKKAVALRVMYDALDRIEDRLKKEKSDELKIMEFHGKHHSQQLDAISGDSPNRISTGTNA